MERDLRDLDHKFHHLQSVFHQVEHDAEFLGYGHIQGNTAHVKRLLDTIEDSIHQMRLDIAVIRRRMSFHRGDDSCRNSRPFYRSSYGVYGSRGNIYGGIGFTIGGGSSRIYIGF